MANYPSTRTALATLTLVGILTSSSIFSGCKEKPIEKPSQSQQQVEDKSSIKPDKVTLDKVALDKVVLDKVPLEYKLPKPMFVGTPQDLRRKGGVEDTTGKKLPLFYVPKGTKNLALGKQVSSSDNEPIIGELELVTDGDKEATDGSFVELGPFRQHVTIDLEKKSNIYAIVVWHYHKQARIYDDVVVQVANDPDFILNVKTLFNNDKDNSSGLGVGEDRVYVDNNNGKLIDAKGVLARYVRLYSKGNSGNDLNHYIEVEVHGKPVIK